MAEHPSEQTPVAELSYEQARDELVAIVARIEGGQAPLEESMRLWERGEQLAAHCQACLDRAQEQLDRATAGGAQNGADGSGGSGGSGADDGEG